MSDLFISYVQEDSELAEQLARGLEQHGFSTWYYERDILVGETWLEQVARQIGEAKAVVIVISPRSLKSRQVVKEIEWVDEQEKPLIPLLLEITHDEIGTRSKRLAVTLGTTVKIPIPSEGVTERFLERLAKGLLNLRVEPSTEEAAPDRFDERLAEAGGLLRDRSTISQAEDILRSLREEHPDSPKVHRYLGKLYNRSFRPDDAVASFERAVELEPENALLQWELGLARQSRGHARDAAESLRKAVELGLDPDREKRALTLLDRLGASKDPAGER